MVRRSLILLATVAIVASACSSSGATTAPATSAPTTAATVAPATSAPTTAPSTAPTAPPVAKKVTVIAPNPSALVWFNLCTAMGQGYMAAEGLDVTFQALDGSGAVLQAMAAGQAQFGIPGPGPVLAAWERGEKPVMFYDQYPQSLFGLVVPTDGSVKTVADLKGKVIGSGTVDGAEVGFAAGHPDRRRTQGRHRGGAQGRQGGLHLPAGRRRRTAFAAFGRSEIAAYAAGISDMTIIRARGLALTEITPAEVPGVLRQQLRGAPGHHRL